MKNIAVVGYNIFSPGGTTRSNLNLIKEFSTYGAQLSYFNEVEFTKSDVLKLKQSEGLRESVKFYSLYELERHQNMDLYIITRETYFKFAKVIKKLNPKSKVVGEIHGPIPLIKQNLSEILPFLDCVRVATSSIKEHFIKKYNYHRVFVQTVSLDHLKNIPLQKTQRTNNLLIFSRFDEESKDIAYAIKLVAYIVHELKFQEIRLFINGYGIGENLYVKLINYYKVHQNVIMNGQIPKDYVYMCTSKYETFGYSIVEAISKGHRATLYCGDDNVIKENFKDFKTVTWLTKNLIKDGEQLVQLLTSHPRHVDNEYDRQLINRLSQNYVPYFLNNISKFHSPITKVHLTKKELQTILGKEKAMKIYYSQIKKVYRYSCTVPLLGLILKSTYFKKPIFKMIDLLKKVVKTEKGQLKENAFFVESFHGKNFSGDPKYLSLAIKKENPEAEIFVSSVNDLVDMEIRSYGFIPVRFKSAGYVQKFKQCKYVIINGNTVDLLGKQDGQIFIQTWHGFPLKRMVHDLKNKSQRKKETKAFFPRMLKWDYLLTSSPFNTHLLSSAFLLKYHKKLNIIEDGLPKNEFLIEHKNSESFRESLHLKYFNKKYPANKKYILFCPTWRKGKRKQVTNIDLIELVSSLPKEYDIIVKLHPNESFLVDQYMNIHERIHCFYNELVDIQELYILSEVLISDYSSSIFDFAHLNRKIIVLQEDIEQYHNHVGWYFDIERVCSLKGGQYTTEQLVGKILELDHKVYNKRIKYNLLTYDQIGSTKKVLNKILKFE